MEYIFKTPQIGEVGHEVMIVKLHKQKGEYIKKDEPIATLETNKAALEIESNVSGYIKEIYSSEGRRISIGSPLLLIDTDAAMEIGHGQIVAQYGTTIATHNNVDEHSTIVDWIKQLRNKDLSPRDKSYCLEQKVVPIHMHRNFKKYSEQHAGRNSKNNDYYDEVVLSKQQARLLQNLVESKSDVVQANIQCICDNACIEQYRKRLRNQSEPTLIPSRLEIVAWSVVTAMRSHPRFRSRLIGQDQLRQFKNPNLGIAVALPDDELTTAVVHNSFSYNFEQFVEQCRTSIVDAKNDNHITTYFPLVISDLSIHGVDSATPVVASPSCATLFVGRPLMFNRAYFYLSLSFDHRFINGVGAARFLDEVQSNIGAITA